MNIPMDREELSVIEGAERSQEVPSVSHVGYERNISSSAESDHSSQDHDVVNPVLDVDISTHSPQRQESAHVSVDPLSMSGQEDGTLQEVSLSRRFEDEAVNPVAISDGNASLPDVSQSSAKDDVFRSTQPTCGS